MSSVQSISTDRVKVCDKVLLYRDTLRDLFGGLESKIEKKSQFSAGFEHASIGDIALCRYTASAHQVERTSTFARRDQSKPIKVAFQVKGSSFFQQGSRGLMLSPGEWSIYDTATPYTATMLSDVQFLFLTLPRERIASKQYELKELTLRRFPAHYGVGKLAYEFAHNTFDQIEKVGARSEPDIVDTMVHLLRLTLIDCSGSPSIGSQGEILCDRIKSYLTANLRDPQLSIEKIAVTLNCSKRYLHKVFKEEGVSISDYIWQSRLDHCREELLKSQSDHRSITDIAFSWGFNSSAHFSTAFKDRFGSSPRYYRDMSVGRSSRQVHDPVKRDSLVPNIMRAAKCG